jgi:hypothetical protein
MRWQELRTVKASTFKRLVGVTPELFEKMRAYLSAEQSTCGHKFPGDRRGPRPKLCTEDELLMMLMYYREYRTFLHIGTTYGVAESQAWKIITRIEKQLAASRLFALPGKKTLVQADHHFEIVLVDVSEHPVERPKKSSGPTIQAKRKGTP